MTEQFDNSLDFDKSTEENDDDDDAKGESTEEDIIETDVEDHHALNKRRQPSSLLNKNWRARRGKRFAVAVLYEYTPWKKFSAE